MTNQRIYLDYNATTPVDPRVLERMLPFFTAQFGNASSRTHSFGWEAEEAVDMAREQVAELIGAKPGEIYFTSGATEATHLALLGICNEGHTNGNHIITCVTEHKAVLDTCLYLEKRGYQVTWLSVDAKGRIDLDELQTAIRETTALICLMHANNETGVLHPIAEVAAIAQAHHIPLLTDATQSVGKLEISVRETPIDLMAFSAHKLYGPKGVGALYVRNGIFSKMQSSIRGGGQERGMRPGTLNVPGIVGFGMACEICAETQENEAIRPAPQGRPGGQAAANAGNSLRDNYFDRCAWSWMSTAFSARDTGQLTLVSAAMRWNVASSIFGTTAVTVSAIRVMVKASPTFSTVHAALVSTLVAGVPFFSSPPLSAMLKHAASAAASSSSGFEPPACSKREPKLYAPEIPDSPL